MYYEMFMNTKYSFANSAKISAVVILSIGDIGAKFPFLGGMPKGLILYV